MKEFQFDQDAYLQRIGCVREVNGTIEGLRGIHHAQLYTIPFENFDIFLGRGIELEPEKLFQKLVLQKRGGYCFELNGLFLMALQSFGFDARALLARVYVDGEPRGRGHQISLVTIEGKEWIADVGFGRDNPRAPIPFVLNQPTTNDGHTVRLVKTQHYGTLFQVKNNGIWEDRYSFDLEYVCPADIEYGNHFTSTFPKSLFVNAWVAALPVKKGAITLFNNRLKKTVGEKVTQTELEEGQKYLEALEDHFGIKLDAAYDDLRPFKDMGPNPSF